jgi:hypothetical protein
MGQLGHACRKILLYRIHSGLSVSAGQSTVFLKKKAGQSTHACRNVFFNPNKSNQQEEPLLGKLFFIALFFSYFKSSINLEVISELGHHCVRRTRLEQIVSGGCD